MSIQANITGNYSESAQYPSAAVNITNHCNLQCRHCFVFREGNPNEAPASIRDEMADDVMLDTLEKLRDRHQIKQMLWMGGEPMLKPKLLKKGVRLFQQNTITTNGTAPLIDFGEDLLYVISMDGPEDLNDAIRGDGVYRKVLGNIEHLPPDFGSQVQVQTVVTRRNHQRMEELVSSIMQTRVGWMTFSFMVPKNGELDNPDVWGTNEERVEAVQTIMELKRKYPRFIRNSMRHLELMMPPYAERVTSTCPALQSVLSLYLEGDHFTTPFCCYGNDVDCARCGAWVVFHRADRMERAGLVDWESETQGG
jgi:sulfatase maturation enzyme AslB (radical SAM superfamily)|tara:strand:+ start:205 stop:1131 length:927 start_codon:yes stop_codon:yes gene_type:complete